MRIQHKSSAYLNNNKLRLANVVYFAFAVATNTAYALPTYSITNIGVGANDINNKGQVAGSGTTESTQGKIHAFRYTDGVGLEDLEVVPATPSILAWHGNHLPSRRI